MRIVFSNCVTIEEPTDEIVRYCYKNFWVKNPEYETRKRIGKWLGNTPEKLYLFSEDRARIFIPIGLFAYLKQLIPEDVKKNVVINLADDKKADFDTAFDLYDYQKTAVEAMKRAGYGILHSKAGSGKTQMGLALAADLGYKTLWLTHTEDLLNQSYERAKRYIDRGRLAKITEGKVSLSDITFATVQTMSKLALPEYKYCFNTVVVDECHRIYGSPSKMGQFAKVVNSLAARHKFGLSATVHRSDGMEKSMYAYVGGVRYSVPDGAVKDRVMDVSVEKFQTGITFNDLGDFIDTDGTLVWSKYITSLGTCLKRRLVLVKKIAELLSCGRHILVLSDRISLLEDIYTDFTGSQHSSVGYSVLTGKTKRSERIKIIEDTRSGANRLLLSTYSLAKEGLDIPCLDTLVMATPVKDYAVTVQAVGRIARSADNKNKPLVIDVVDDDPISEKLFKIRCRHYRGEGCLICRTEKTSGLK